MNERPSVNERLRALNRFGLGARVGEAARLDDPRGWLHAQLDAPRGATAPDGPSLAEAADAIRALRAARRARDQEAVRAARRGLGELLRSERRTALERRVRSESPMVERLIAFWSNHLCVSAAAKRQVAALAGHYERTVVVPHVLGRFEEMVLASARHPAMLFYLDNVQSIGPDSRAGRHTTRRQGPRGLNENYARELLELHTLGVDGGYDQADVEALAEIMTGWTVAGVGPGASDGEPLGFVFRAALHQPGDKTVLGRTYPGRGVVEGEDSIRDLCRHPSTARFVATKLVRHFVSDDPPGAAVDRIAGVFADTEGDLAEVAHALVDLEIAWTTGHKKFRTPQEWLVAVFRAFYATEVPERAPAILQQLRHPLWAPPAPKGFEDTRGPWSDPDALMNRAELARSIARGLAGGAGGSGRAGGRRRFGGRGRLGGRERLGGRGRFGGRGHDGGSGPDGPAPDPRVLLGVVDVPADDPLRALLSDDSISVPDRLALGIGGPAFQWR